MNLALLVYLASIVNGIAVLFALIGIIGALIYFTILACMHFSTYGVREHSFESIEEISKQKKVKETYTKYWKLSAFIFPMMIMVSILLPSERTIYLMTAAYATEQIAKNDRVQKIGNDVLNVIEKKISEMNK